MFAAIRRFFHRQMFLLEYQKSLNERAKVEEELYRAARGADPFPDAKKLREWAVRLGVPEKWRH